MWWKAITDTLGGENGILGGVTDIIDKFTVSKQEKLQMKLEVQKMLQEKEALLLKDVQNARSMQMEALKQDDLFSKRFLYYFAMASIFLAFLFIFLITFLEIPEQNIRFADTILGVVIGTVFGSIFNFFFGSSQGSKTKTMLMDENLKSITRETLTIREKRQLKKAGRQKNKEL